MWSLAAQGVNFAGSAGSAGSGGGSSGSFAPSSEFVNDADGDLNMKNHKITNLTNPSSNSDGVNKHYVDTTKHNLSTHLILNSKQIWFNDTERIRMHYIFGDDFDGVALIAPSGLFISNGTDTILTASPSGIFVNNKRITSVAAPVVELDAANKRYVDTTIDANKFTGDMKNKKITNLLTPATDNDATNKRYVDITIDANKFSGDMENKKITNLTTPTDTNDASTKDYVDYMTLRRIKAEDMNMNNFRITNLRVSTVATDAARVDQLFTGDMRNKRITNLADPIYPQDAVTKSYLKTHELKNIYIDLKEKYNPTFWISSKFSLGFEGDKSTVQDLSGTGFTLSAGSLDKTLTFSPTTTLQTTASYGTTYTFIIKGKRTSSNGRLFTSTQENIVFGWWSHMMKCCWIDGEIWGILSNLTNNDGNVHTYILTNNNDAKKFYENKSLIITTNGGIETWKGNVVLGKPVQFENEVATGQFEEVICFDKVLSEEEIFDIYDKILA